MQLIDILRSASFQELREKMGARVSDYFGANPIPYKAIRTPDYFEISLEDEDFVIDNTLQYLGKDVICYIREQKMNHIIEAQVSTFKFHLTQCNTISKAINEGRDTRFRIHRRNDDRFSVYPIIRGVVRDEQVNVKMNVCKSCLRTLRYPGYANGTQEQREKIINEFNIANYVAHGIRGVMPQLAEPMLRVNRDRLLIQLSNMHCSKCDRNLQAHSNWLRIHHINGRHFDYGNGNISILCLGCYAKANGLPKMEDIRDYGAFQEAFNYN